MFVCVLTDRIETYIAQTKMANGVGESDGEAIEQEVKSRLRRRGVD